MKQEETGRNRKTGRKKHRQPYETGRNRKKHEETGRNSKKQYKKQ